MRRLFTIVALLGFALLVAGIAGCGETQLTPKPVKPKPLCLRRGPDNQNARALRCAALRPTATAIFPVRHGRDARRVTRVTRRGTRFASAASPVVGEILTTTTGTWTNTPAGFTYQWQRCAAGSCTNVPGATANSYTIVNADLGDTIQVVVTASNAGGSTPKTSAPTGVVTSGLACTLYASPTGSDTGNTGTINSPFATPSKLETSLTAGQVGCLQPGSYGSTTSANPMVLGPASGSSSGAITITSADPGNPAQLLGWVSIQGNYVTLQDVNINGMNPAHVGNPCTSGTLAEAMEVEGNNDIIQYVDYQQIPNGTSLPGNAIGIGFPGAGHGDNTIIRYNAIHDVGYCQAYDHLIYLSHGNNVQIYDNWMWNDAHGFGMQVYPCPSNASIHSNVVDKAAAGSTVLDGSSCTVVGNALTHNVFANSVGNSSLGTPSAYALLICCGGPLGSGNTFQNNDSFNNSAGINNSGISSAMTVSNNITSDPLFVNAAAHNYAVQSGSPVAGYGLPAAVGPSAGP